MNTARRILLALLLVLGAALLPSAAHAQAAAPGATTPVAPGGAPQIGGFSARALDENGNTTPQTYFMVDLKPGDRYEGNLLVSNGSDKKVKLDVYSVDGLTGATTGTVYANKDDARKGASTWITPVVDQITVRPGKAKVLRFKVKVPADATPGDHVGALAMQSADNPKSKGQFAITEIIRVAVAVQIRVKGEADKKLDITSLGIKALGGTQIPSVTVGMANTGQLLCKPVLTVRMEQDGKPVGNVRRELDTVLPGQSIQYPLPWPTPLPAGKYDATATTEACGPTSEKSQELELKGELTGSTTAPGSNGTVPSTKTGVPLWALILVGGLALGGGFLLARRKPREKKKQAAEPGEGG